MSKLKERIYEFCKVCDLYKKDDACQVGRENQIRYASREWCGWGMVNGERVFISSDYVESSFGKIPRNPKTKLLELTESS